VDDLEGIIFDRDLFDQLGNVPARIHTWRQPAPLKIRFGPEGLSFVNAVFAQQRGKPDSKQQVVK
jgi:hypothetical protein